MPLDSPLLLGVGPEALVDLPQGDSRNQGRPVIHIADKFRQAYIEQAARLKEKEWREWQSEQKKKFRSSKALQAVSKWLDEE